MDMADAVMIRKMRRRIKDRERYNNLDKAKKKERNEENSRRARERYQNMSEEERRKNEPRAAQERLDHPNVDELHSVLNAEEHAKSVPGFLPERCWEAEGSRTGARGGREENQRPQRRW